MTALIMAKYHEPSIGKTSDWYTPKSIFDGLNLSFDLDPAHPGFGSPYCVVPARRIFTIDHDGLRQPWHGLTFMNPPYGGRCEHVPWLRKFLDHGNGIAIVRAYTSSGWFHEHVVPRAETLCFPNGKTKFVRPDGSIGEEPGHGVVLIGMGEIANTALERSGLGFFVRVRSVS
jgi:DNA N-6-adenine-methyltransferase (Dam)